MEQAHANLLGVVLNKLHTGGPGYYQSYYYGYYRSYAAAPAEDAAGSENGVVGTAKPTAPAGGLNAISGQSKQGNA